MRGTHQSEGAFTIWHSASNDSYDTMQWISQQVNLPSLLATQWLDHICGMLSYSHGVMVTYMD
jgi:hypothetical protein